MFTDAIMLHGLIESIKGGMESEGKKISCFQIFLCYLFDYACMLVISSH